MISGLEFYKKCNWNLCRRYPIKFDYKSIKDGDFIFINLDDFYTFLQLVQSQKIHKFNLITHNSDLSFDEKMFNLMSPFVNEIFAINCVVNSKMFKIPLGFSDRLIPVISSMSVDNNKQHLLYLNFNIHSGRIPERVECRNYFSKFEWSKYEDLVPENQYYKNLMISKYSACPIGAGLDTHRFYESIYFDTIPIVKRNDISDLHSKFPCIIVDTWSEINNNFLIDNYETNLNKLMYWKKNNDWLNPSFWLK
jgi:hypothetical protein